MALLVTAIKTSRLLRPQPVAPPDPQILRRWLRVVRVATAAVLPVVATAAVRMSDPGGLPLVVSFVALACAGSLWRLRHGADETGLGLAAGAGLVMCAILVIPILGEPDRLFAGLWGLWWAGHAVQVGGIWRLWALKSGNAATPTAAERSPAFKRWLWVLRAIALAGLLSWIAIPPLVLLVPLYVLLLIGGDRRSVLQGGMLAGSFGSLFCTLWLIQPGADRTRLDLSPVSFQVALLIVGAVCLRTHRLLPVETDRLPGHWRRFSVGLVTVALASASVTSSLVMADYSRRFAASETSVIRIMREVNSASAAYENTYANGYALTLAGMEPPPAGQERTCEAAGTMLPLRDIAITRSYRFEYSPGPSVEKAGPGCAGPGAKSFIFMARPLRYNETGRRSFFLDERGNTFVTDENRAPTAQDPPLQ